MTLQKKNLAIAVSSLSHVSILKQRAEKRAKKIQQISGCKMSITEETKHDGIVCRTMSCFDRRELAAFDSLINCIFGIDIKMTRKRKEVEGLKTRRYIERRQNCISINFDYDSVTSFRYRFISNEVLQGFTKKYSLFSLH